MSSAFSKGSSFELITDEEVINAIRRIPEHYASNNSSASSDARMQWVKDRLEAAQGRTVRDYAGSLEGGGSFNPTASGVTTSGLGSPGETIVYVWYNRTTGQLLKVGSAPGGGAPGGPANRIAGQYEGLRTQEATRLGVPVNQVELGVHYLRFNGAVPRGGPQGVELLLRIHLRDQGHQLPLDLQGRSNPAAFTESPVHPPWLE